MASAARSRARALESVDPGGKIWKRIGPERALGSVVWQAAEIEAPGVIAHHYGDRMPIGEPTGEKTERAAALSRLLTSAGIKSPVRPESAQRDLAEALGQPELQSGERADAGNADRPRHRPRHAPRDPRHDGGGPRAWARRWASPSRSSADERMDMAAKVGAHRTSMLQDVEAGRPTELDALLGVVIELAGLVKIGTPSLQLVYDLCKFRCQTSITRSSPGKDGLHAARQRKARL